ncbi:MAG: NAD(P)H-hydrate epimerase [Actinomycetota bacterium]
MPESRSEPEPWRAVAVPAVAADRLAWITERDMVEVDRVMIDELHIELIQMMEHAGRHLARVVREGATPSTVVVLAGSGGNGGGGLVAARHLANAGIEVVVVTTRDRVDMAPVPAHQLDILERMGVERRDEPPAGPSVDLVVDAVIGYSLRGAPRGRSADLIEATVGSPIVVSLDTPSGLDVTTGDAPGRSVAADATVTLALPKIGLRHAAAVGELYLGDISVPPGVTGAYGVAPPPFDAGGLLLVER